MALASSKPSWGLASPTRSVIYHQNDSVTVCRLRNLWVQVPLSREAAPVKYEMGMVNEYQGGTGMSVTDVSHFGLQS